MSNTKSFLNITEVKIVINFCIMVGLSIFISWIIQPDGFGAIGSTAITQAGTISTPGDPNIGWRIVIWFTSIPIILLRLSYIVWKSEQK